MDGQEPLKPGDRVVLHGEVADMRGDFALVTVDGSAPGSGYLSVDCGFFELEDQAVLHGEVTAIRVGFAVVVVDGSLPPGSMIGVKPRSLELDVDDDLPAGNSVLISPLLRDVSVQPASTRVPLAVALGMRPADAEWVFLTVSDRPAPPSPPRPVRLICHAFVPSARSASFSPSRARHTATTTR